jgi:Protein tyrosine and serine/threonine kinase
VIYILTAASCCRYVQSISLANNIFRLFRFILGSLQALSGKLPYHYIAKDSEVLITLHRGTYPPRPQELADDHWELITRCWAEDPHIRPDIKYVSNRIQNHYWAQFTATDCGIVSRIPSSVKAATADSTVILRGALFSTLAFIGAVIFCGFVLYHTFIH